MLSKLKIKTKMMISLCGVILCIYAITIFLVMRSTNSILKEEAFQKNNHLAAQYSLLVKGRIEHALQTAQAIAHTCEGMILNKEQPNKTTIKLILQQIMDYNPGFSGVWIMLDPQSLFDEPYFPWFYRDKGNLVFESIDEIESYKEQTSEVYYAIPKQQKKDVLLDPYMDPDINIMMTTTAVPILVNGKCLGVVGIDFTLEALTQLVSTIRPYGTGTASLLSNTCNYIAHPDSARISRPLGGDSPVLTDASRAIKNGEQFSATLFPMPFKKKHTGYLFLYR